MLYFVYLCLFTFQDREDGDMGGVAEHPSCEDNQQDQADLPANPNGPNSGSSEVLYCLSS